MIKITHLAHAGFLIENDKERLIIDPADNSFGYEIKNEIVNYLLISHEHWDHNNIKDIKLEDNTGSFVIQKINSYHDNEKGGLRGKNIIHIMNTEGIRICHLGDLGHVLTAEQIKQIVPVDILLIPVGGIYTIDYKEALDVVKQLNPSTIIPMHYKTNKWGNDKKIDGVDKFIENIKGYKLVNKEGSLHYKKTNEKTVYII